MIPCMEPVNDESIITASDLLVKYDRVIALDSFSVSLPQGIIGMLGPNGSGKSTFVKVAMGLKLPDRGTLKINNMIPWMNIDFLRDSIGYMPEYDCLIDELNAITFVSYFGRISGLTKEDSIMRSHTILDFVGIEEERYRKIASYSTGMRQRIKLAQALVHDPPILFLDEPTEGMDPEGREEMLDLVSKIGKSGKTIVICSHLLHEVEKVAEHIVIMNEGKVINSGSIEKVLAGEKETVQIRLNGDPKDIKSFMDYVLKHFSIINSKTSGGKLYLVIKGLESDREFFKIAKEHSLQIRAFRPHVRNLEDFFMMSFEGGE